MRKEKFIQITGESVKKIANIFKVGERAVQKALNYESNSDLAKRIRTVAMKEFGGVIWEATTKTYKEI